MLWHAWSLNEIDLRICNMDKGRSEQVSAKFVYPCRIVRDSFISGTNCPLICKRRRLFSSTNFYEIQIPTLPRWISIDACKNWKLKQRRRRRWHFEKNSTYTSEFSCKTWTRVDLWLTIFRVERRRSKFITRVLKIERLNSELNIAFIDRV